MTKGEAEKAIRHLCGQWAAEENIPRSSDHHASFSDFKSWLQSKGYSHYLDFRSTMGANETAETWFDDEFKQYWRR